MRSQDLGTGDNLLARFHWGRKDSVLLPQLCKLPLWLWKKKCKGGMLPCRCWTRDAAGVVRVNALIRLSQGPEGLGVSAAPPSAGGLLVPCTAPGLSQSRTGASFPTLSCPGSLVHLPRNIPIWEKPHPASSPFRGEVYAWPLKAAELSRQAPMCLAVLSCESTAFSGSHHGREQTELGMVIGQKLQANG